MKWFWGKTKNTGHFRFHTSTLLEKPEAQPRLEQKHYAVREITGMYGLQIRGVFLGFIKIGRYSNEQSDWKPVQGGGSE